MDADFMYSLMASNDLIIFVDVKQKLVWSR